MEKGGFEWKGNDLIVGGEVVANLIHNEDGTWSYQSDFSEGEEAWETKLDAQKEAEEAIIGDAYSPNATKYSQYQLPGGENYKELLLTMPSREQSWKNLDDFKQSMRDKYGNGWKDKMSKNESDSFESFVNGEARRPKETFKSSHFDEPNILAHIRFNERTDSEGNKVLFIEEWQADKGQEWQKLKKLIDSLS